MGNKVKAITNPTLQKTIPAYGVEMVLQARCATGELKIPEATFLDKQFNTIWKVNDYPDLFQANHFPLPFNQYYHDKDT